MYKIGLVEDEKNLNSLVKNYLEKPKTIDQDFNNKITTANTHIITANILYSFFKNVKEPSLINLPTFSIFSFLAGRLFTHL